MTSTVSGISGIGSSASATAGAAKQLVVDANPSGPASDPVRPAQRDGAPADDDRSFRQPQISSSTAEALIGLAGGQDRGKNAAPKPISGARPRTTAIPGMSAAQIAALSPSRIRAMTSSQIASLGATEVGALSPAQLAALWSARIGAISAPESTGAPSNTEPNVADPAHRAFDVDPAEGPGDGSRIPEPSRAGEQGT